MFACSERPLHRLGVEQGVNDADGGLLSLLGVEGGPVPQFLAALGRRHALAAPGRAWVHMAADRPPPHSRPRPATPVTPPGLRLAGRPPSLRIACAATPATAISGGWGPGRLVRGGPARPSPRCPRHPPPRRGEDGGGGRE